jgi:hypothetical protein
LRGIAEGHGFAGIEFLEPAIDEVQALLDLYVQVWYAPGVDLTPKARRQAVWTWWRLRWRLWLARIWRRTREESHLDTEDAARSSGAPAAQRPTV